MQINRKTYVATIKIAMHTEQAE